MKFGVVLISLLMSLPAPSRPRPNSDHNTIDSHQKTPPELIKAVLRSKIKDKVAQINEQNKKMMAIAREKKSFIDSLKFRLLRKFNSYESLKKRRILVEDLEIKRKELESEFKEIKADLEDSHETVERQRKMEENRSQMVKVSGDGLESVELVMQKLKRLFVYKLVNLKTFNKQILSNLALEKQKNDEELANLNGGLGYLKKKLKKLGKQIKTTKFHSKAEKIEWGKKTQLLISECKAQETPKSAELQALSDNPAKFQKQSN